MYYYVPMTSQNKIVFKMGRPLFSQDRLARTPARLVIVQGAALIFYMG
jgi:hypothetical protein